MTVGHWHAARQSAIGLQVGLCSQARRAFMQPVSLMIFSSKQPSQLPGLVPPSGPGEPGHVSWSPAHATAHGTPEAGGPHAHSPFGPPAVLRSSSNAVASSPRQHRRQSWVAAHRLATPSASAPESTLPASEASAPPPSCVLDVARSSSTPTIARHATRGTRPSAPTTMSARALTRHLAARGRPYRARSRAPRAAQRRPDLGCSVPSTRARRRSRGPRHR